MLRLCGSGKHSDQQRKAINMGKAENNFENKWLEEREDGFFYTMPYYKNTYNRKNKI